MRNKTLIDSVRDFGFSPTNLKYNYLGIWGDVQNSEYFIFSDPVWRNTELPVSVSVNNIRYKVTNKLNEK